MDWTSILWLGLMLLFLVIEGTTVALVSLWFAVGALAAIPVSLLGGEIWLQVVVFVVVSGAALAMVRPLIRKYMKPKLVATNTDALIGTTGRVIADIDNIAAQGRVKLGGMEWSARSTDGSPIRSDTVVRVDQIQGAKVHVSPVSQTVH